MADCYIVFQTLVHYVYYVFVSGKIFASGMPFLRKVSHVKKKDDGPCPICMSELSEASGFTEGTVDNSGVYKLTKCGHMLHTPCVKAYIDNSSFSQVIIRAKTNTNE